jgi:hypothetical protein
MQVSNAKATGKDVGQPLPGGRDATPGLPASSAAAWRNFRRNLSES